MWWLLGLAALFFGGSSSSKKSPATRALDESQLSPAELAEHRRLKESAVAAEREVVATRKALGEAQHRLRIEERGLSQLRTIIGVVFVVEALLTAIWLLANMTDRAEQSGILVVCLAVMGGTAWLARSFYVFTARDRDTALQRESDCVLMLSRQERVAPERVQAFDAFVSSTGALVARRREESDALARSTQLALEQAEGARRREAARIAEEAERARERAAREREQLISLVKAAFVHWNTDAKNPKTYVAQHADQLIANEERIVSAYVDGSLPGATADDCVRLATKALEEIPGEIAYWLPNASHRTVARISLVLRRHNGDWRERFLPLAWEFVQQRVAPAKPKAVAAATGSARKPLSPTLTAAIKRLPPDLAAEVSERVSDAITLAHLGSIKADVMKSRRTELKRRRVSEADIQRDLDELAGNLNTLDKAWALEKGLTPHGARH